MNKYFIITLAFLFFIFSASAQDLIITKNGDDIKAKVIEVDLFQVKYKKYENIDGPIYTILIKDLLIIRYENGSKDFFKRSKNNDNSVKIIDTNRIKFINNKKKNMNLIEVSSFYNSNSDIFQYVDYNQYNYRLSYTTNYWNPISVKFINGYKFNEQVALGIGLEYTEIGPFDFFTLSSELFCYTNKNKNSPFININYGVFQFLNQDFNFSSTNYTYSGKVGYKFILNKGALQLSLGYKNIIQSSNLIFTNGSLIPTNGYFIPTISYLFN